MTSKPTLDLQRFTKIATATSQQPTAQKPPVAPAQLPEVSELLETGRIHDDTSHPIAETKAEVRPRFAPGRGGDAARRESRLQQQDANARLKNLKRSKQREVKNFVNVPLDDSMKARLKAVAHETDVPMAWIMIDALDYYLAAIGR